MLTVGVLGYAHSMSLALLHILLWPRFSLPTASQSLVHSMVAFFSEDKANRLATQTNLLVPIPQSKQ